MKSSTNCARECGSVGQGGCRCMCARKILKNTVVLVFGLSLVCKEKELDNSQFYEHLFS